MSRLEPQCDLIYLINMLICCVLTTIVLPINEKIQYKLVLSVFTEISFTEIHSGVSGKSAFEVLID